MNDDIFFSVIIPTYNRAHLLPQTIDSVLSQTYKNFELIIVDDGSTDNTKELVASYHNPQITYLWKPNEERAIARNTGMSMAKGDYLTFLDSDDIFYPNHLAHASEMLAKFDSPHFYRQAYEVKNESGKILEKKNKVSGDANIFILNGNYFSCIGVFLKKEVVIDCQFSKESIEPSEDWEYWLRLSVRHKFFYDNTITSCMINHAGRSMLVFDEEVGRLIISRVLKGLKRDSVFMEKRVGYLNVVHAQMLTLLCLKKVVSGKNNGIFVDLFSSYALSLGELFRRRTLAIMKYFILNMFGKN